MEYRGDLRKTKTWDSENVAFVYFFHTPTRILLVCSVLNVVSVADLLAYLSICDQVKFCGQNLSVHRHQQKNWLDGVLATSFLLWF